MPTHTFQNRKPSTELLPEGKALLTLKGWKTDTINKKEVAILRWESEGIAIKDNLFLTEAAGWRVDQFLVATGKAAEGDEGKEFEFPSHEMLPTGLRVWADIGVETFEGKDKKSHSKNAIKEYLAEPVPGEEEGF
jgi:hypothetical protein